MNSKNIAVGIVILIVMGLGAFVIFNVGMSDLAYIPSDGASLQEELVHYDSVELGLSFGYPKDYILQEKTINEAERFHKQIVLVENTETNKSLLSGKVVGDGPTAITIDVVQNNLDKYTADGFAKGNAISNYKMGDGEMVNLNISGLDGVAYGWDGLYRGESVVVATDKYVYVVSVTYIEASDKIITDFMSVMESFSVEH